MAKDQESTEAQSSVHYQKFDNDDVTGGTGPSNVTNRSRSPAATANHVSEQRSRVSVEPPEVVTMEPDVTNSPTAVLPHHEVVLEMNGTTPTQTTPEQPEDDTWTWLNLVLSIASIFCCTVCGILATVTAVLAYIDHRVRDFDASRKKRLASYALALTALIAGIICMVIVIVVAIHYDNVNSKP